MLLAAALRLSRSACRASGSTRPSRPSTCCIRASRDAATRSRSTENSPPLWYIVEWVSLSRSRHRRDRAAAALGAGRDRAPSRSPGRSARSWPGAPRAIAAAALVAVGPMFVWYSQEARVYGLYVLLAALAMLCFLRLLDAARASRRVAAFALAGALALLTPLLRGLPARGRWSCWLLAASAGRSPPAPRCPRSPRSCSSGSRCCR